MRKPTTILFVFILFAASAFAADARAEIAGVYKQVDTLLKSKDVAGLTKLFKERVASDFTFTGKGGVKMNAEQFLNQMKSQLAVTKSIQTSSTHIDKLTIKGDSATAWTTSKVVGTVQIEQNKPMTVSDTESSREVWIRQSGVWKLRSSKALSSKTLINGKPFGGSAPTTKRG